MVSETQVKQRRHCARPIEALHRLTLAQHPAGATNEIRGAASMASCVQKGASKGLQSATEVSTSWRRGALVMQLSLHD